MTRKHLGADIEHLLVKGSPKPMSKMRYEQARYLCDLYQRQVIHDPRCSFEDRGAISIMCLDAAMCEIDYLRYRLTRIQEVVAELSAFQEKLTINEERAE